MHNVLNATATFAIGLMLDIKIDSIKKSLISFSGVQRRLTLIYENKNSLIYDDYAHHPTEIKAVLSACKNNFKNKKIIAIFQPHRFSRVSSLYKDFISSFANADEVLVCPVYSAGEKNNNFNFDRFCKNIILKSKVTVIQTKSKIDIENYINKNFLKNQVIIAMGAGNISYWIREISNKIK